MQALIQVVDDDGSFRISIARLLRALGFAVETFESAEQLLMKPPGDDRLSCILLDMRMPGLTGPDLQDRLRSQGSIVPIIFLTGNADVQSTVRVIKAGAEDLLTKPVNKETLVQAIERALMRARSSRQMHEQLGALRELVNRLSPRERQVFERVAHGRMNKQIARELGTTERTIKAHRHGVSEKLGVASVAELAVIAERLGILAKASPADEKRSESPPAAG